nr:hypothetical protein Itr_chr08CG14020 [Ipomoea trifida]
MVGDGVQLRRASSDDLRQPGVSGRRSKAQPPPVLTSSSLSLVDGKEEDDNDGDERRLSLSLTHKTVEKMMR